MAHVSLKRNTCQFEPSGRVGRIDEALQSMDKQNGSSKKSQKDFNNSNKRNSRIGVCTDPNCTLKIGDIVWARLTTRSVWWPGVVVDPRTCGYDLNESVWVYWIGDQRISDVLPENTVSIMDNFEGRYRIRGSANYHKSVEEALKLFFEQNGIPLPTNVVTAALNGFTGKLREDIHYALRRNTHKILPIYIRQRLSEINSQVSLESAQMKTLNHQLPSEYSTNSPTATTTSSFSEDFLKRCKNWQIVHEAIVMSVIQSPNTTAFFVHQGIIFSWTTRILMEKSAKFTGYKEGYHVVDDDGKKEVCTLCGHTGSLIVCDCADCPNVFCSACIGEFGGKDLLDKIIEKDPWYCFICAMEKLGPLNPQSDWKKRLSSLFNNENVRDDIDLTLFPNEKQPIRVLSLFDGIATGKIALDELGINIEIYYSCEIDQEALLVTKVNHENQIVYLGDVRGITREKLEEISPIDLLIGGSPCNDVSIANPKRRGLYDPEGTGILFFEYFRILQNLLCINSKLNRNLFWLFENVASMRDCYKTVIDRFLGRPPALYDSRFFSAQNRARYFWGNIPGMYRTDFIVEEDKAPVLDDILTPNCGRKSKMSKVRTITTRTNSLKQGRTFSLCPIEMDGRPDTLWITEIEKLFGLPSHYTDVGGLPPAKRQKLIGQGWTVSVLVLFKRNFGCGEYYKFPSVATLKENGEVHDDNIQVHCVKQRLPRKISTCSRYENSKLELKLKFKNGYHSFWLQDKTTDIYSGLWAVEPTANREKGRLRLFLTHIESNVARLVTTHQAQPSH
ncbi:DNA (cytosine-5)-methyltransferase 3B [Trichinella britovi]|uniref:DNA (cytosine-5-)-methyltransferase n=1 Tax=Trichinella britovi TaxID=45882 RepID=A0A0V1CYZ7_TRIBR|nr:DNA (cytosine-5)-methyltransferase 3B [Trichinella britovi]